MIHHVLLACPRGSEDTSRAFYGGLLGLVEKPKPPALAARGGCWFTGYGVELHLGVEDDFRPARKAHPALLEIPGMRRFHTYDPHGNRLEFLAPVD
jgi:catechol 2,3-dioxygenase-like lactoylglutathione lyase family enzyme